MDKAGVKRSMQVDMRKVRRETKKIEKTSSFITLEAAACIALAASCRSRGLAYIRRANRKTDAVAVASICTYMRIYGASDSRRARYRTGKVLPEARGLRPAGRGSVARSRSQQIDCNLLFFTFLDSN